jgi:nucleotide-binding universal stress UspA family protein
MSKRRIAKKHTRQPRSSGGALWWAVEPFEEDKYFREHALSVLRPFAEALGAPIQPITYIDPFRMSGDVPLSAELASQARTDPFGALRTAAIERLRSMEDKKFKTGFAEPMVLMVQPGELPSLREKAEEISVLAAKHKAAFVALHTHSRRGLTRLYMGSFAETFVSHARVPTLVTNPSCVPPKKISHAVFPTDFSKESLAAYSSFIELAARLRARISIVHYLHVPELSVFIGSGQVASELTADLNKRSEELVRQGKKLTTLAAAKKVKAMFQLLPDRGRFDPSSRILKFAEKESADLIALTAQSGELRATLLGATSRAVVRAAKCPVLVYRNQKR